MVTLKIRSKSQKYNQRFPYSEQSIYAGLVKIHPLVQKLTHRNPILDISKCRCDLENKDMALLFPRSQQCIHASLVKIHPLVQKITPGNEATRMPTPTGSAPKGQSKKDSKDQESIQSSTTSVPGYKMGKLQNHNKHHKQEPTYIQKYQSTRPWGCLRYQYFIGLHSRGITENVSICLGFLLHWITKTIKKT